jgi:hypothetical protein
VLFEGKEGEEAEVTVASMSTPVYARACRCGHIPRTSYMGRWMA